MPTTLGQKTEEWRKKGGIITTGPWVMPTQMGIPACGDS